MPQRSIRFPDELHAAIEAEATRRGKPHTFSSVMVEWATIGHAAHGHYADAVAAARDWAAGDGMHRAAAAGVASREVSAAELEALDASLTAGEQMRNGAGVHPGHRCPVPGCTFTAASPAATCGKHGRKVKAAKR